MTPLTLRTRILLIALLNLALLAAAALVFIRLQFNSGTESFLLAPTENRLRYLADHVTMTLMNTPVESRQAQLQRMEQDYDIHLGLFLNNGQFVAGSVRRPPPEVSRRGIHDRDLGKAAPRGPPVVLREPPRGPPQFDGRPGPPGPPGPRHPIFVQSNADGVWFVLRLPVPAPGEEFPQLGVLFVRTRSVLLNPNLFDSRPWLAGAAVIVALTLACWLPFIRSLTGSIEAMTAGAQRIALGKFDVRLRSGHSAEIARLSDALNRMANQLSGFVHGQKRFMGDVAHELSAPLARLNATLGILEERATGPLARYVEGVKAESTHMAGLVDELLHFSKSEITLRTETRTKVLIADLVGRVLQIEAPGHTGIALSHGGDLAVAAQPERIFRALSNIVRNALRYAGSDGPIHIAARRERGHVFLTVTDSGPGIPEHALDRVFTPFFRLDSSRSPAAGGTGLGMAIVKSCVEASGGVVSCRNRSPRGLEVTIRLDAS